MTKKNTENKKKNYQKQFKSQDSSYITIKSSITQALVFKDQKKNDTIAKALERIFLRSFTITVIRKAIIPGIILN